MRPALPALGGALPLLALLLLCLQAGLLLAPRPAGATRHGPAGDPARGGPDAADPDGRHAAPPQRSSAPALRGTAVAGDYEGSGTDSEALNFKDQLLERARRTHGGGHGEHEAPGGGARAGSRRAAAVRMPAADFAALDAARPWLDHVPGTGAVGGIDPPDSGLPLLQQEHNQEHDAQHMGTAATAPVMHSRVRQPGRRVLLPSRATDSSGIGPGGLLAPGGGLVARRSAIQEFTQYNYCQSGELGTCYPCDVAFFDLDPCHVSQWTWGAGA